MFKQAEMTLVKRKYKQGFVGKYFRANYFIFAENPYFVRKETVPS